MVISALVEVQSVENDLVCDETLRDVGKLLSQDAISSSKNPAYVIKERKSVSDHRCE